MMIAILQPPATAQGKERPVKHPTFYRTIQVDGLSIFYREAGPKDAPVLLLLHGLPSSSLMFEPLFSRPSDRYHLVAPHYPGFGHTDLPDPKNFATSRSNSRSLRPTAGMYRTLRFTSSTQDTPLLIPKRMKLAFEEARVYA